MRLVSLKKHQRWLHICFFFVFVSQMRIPTGENFPVAETFMNNVANSVSRNTKRSFQLSNTQTSVCTAASKSCTGSVDVEGWPLLCSSFTFTRPLSNSLHHFAHYLLPSHYHHTLSPAHNEFQQVELFFAPKKWMSEHILSTLSVQLPFENTAVSVHIIWGADCYWYMY